MTSRAVAGFGWWYSKPVHRVGGYRDTGSLFCCGLKADKQRLDLFTLFWAAATAAEQTAYRGVNSVLLSIILNCEQQQIQILWKDLKLTRCSPLQLHCKLLLTPHPPGHRALYKVPSAPGGQELRGSPLWVARCPAIP